MSRIGTGVKCDARNCVDPARSGSTLLHPCEALPRYQPLAGAFLIPGPKEVCRSVVGQREAGAGRLPQDHAFVRLFDLQGLGRRCQPLGGLFLRQVDAQTQVVGRIGVAQRLLDRDGSGP